MVIVFSNEDWPTYVAGNRLVIRPGRNEVSDTLWGEVKDRQRVVRRVTSGRWEVSLEQVRRQVPDSTDGSAASQRKPSRKGPKKNVPKAKKHPDDLPDGW